jgi:hypothetical protein
MMFLSGLGIAQGLWSMICGRLSPGLPVINRTLPLTPSRARRRLITKRLIAYKDAVIAIKVRVASNFIGDI